MVEEAAVADGEDEVAVEGVLEVGEEEAAGLLVCPPEEDAADKGQQKRPDVQFFRLLIFCLMFLVKCIDIGGVELRVIYDLHVIW